MAYLKTKPYAFHRGGGQRLMSLKAGVVSVAGAEQTGGAFNLFEMTCPPGYATPLHIHYAEDVAVYVLEGALAFFWGSEKREARIGSFFFQPRGAPHGFRVQGDAPARILYLAFPAGLDRFAAEDGLLALNATAAARYKIEILGPLPE